MEVRKEVQWFAEQMEDKLSENDKLKGVNGWHYLPDWRLLELLTEERRELSKAIRVKAPYEEVIREAADVANIVMFIAANAERRHRASSRFTEQEEED